MAVEVNQVPGEPIVIIKYTDPWVPEKDVLEAGPLFAELEKQFEGPIFRITDFRPLTITVSDIVAAVIAVTQRGVVGALADPRVHTLMVGKDVLVKAVQKNLASGKYGNLATPPKLFSTSEDALVYARAQIASFAKGKTG